MTVKGWLSLIKKTARGRLKNKSSRAGHKPSSVSGNAGDDHSSRTGVADGLQRPTRELWAGRPQTLPYLALLRVGFTELPVSPPELVSSYLTVSPLPPRRGRDGGLFSVALSLGSPPLGVTQHPALWSSDFPPANRWLASDHPACSDDLSNNIIRFFWRLVKNQISPLVRPGRDYPGTGEQTRRASRAEGGWQPGCPP